MTRTLENEELKRSLIEEGILLLKSDNICIGEKIPISNHITGIIAEQEERERNDNYICQRKKGIKRRDFSDGNSIRTGKANGQRDTGGKRKEERSVKSNDD